MKKLSTLSSVLTLLLMAACATTPMTPAPVVERSVNVATNNPTINPVTAVRPAAAANVVTPVKPTMAIDGKSYTVKKGDTLFGIALETGLSYRDLAQWNSITNPSYIQVDQILRLTAPNTLATPVVASTSALATPVAMPGTPVITPAKPIAVAAPAIASTPAVPAPVAATGDIVWQWPVKGKTSQPFVEGKSKGLEIAGKMGDAIAAAADGEVVYAGSALKGYGQMLIVKHSPVYLTAYAHNSALMVKEGQQVKRGQKIAEMGNTESDNGQTKLHFELRRSGKPVDPVKLLPAQ